MSRNDYIRLRLVNCGVKVFIRHGSVEDVIPNFRFAEEGVEAVLRDVVEEKIVQGGLGELKILMESYYPLCETFEEPFRGVIKALRKSGLYWGLI